MLCFRCSLCLLETGQCTNSSLDNGQLFIVIPKTITGPSKMCPLHQPKAHLHLLSNQGLSLLYAHGWPWLVPNVQPAGSDARSKPQQACQQTKFSVRVVPILHHTWYSNYCLRKTFLLMNTPVWTAWEIEMSAVWVEWSELPMGATTAIRCSTQ